jgi:hypothetical protein
MIAVAERPTVIDVLVGKVEAGPSERVEVYLRTIHGRRVVSFETIVGGEPSNEPGTRFSVADLGKLQPLIGGAILRAEDEQRGARW